MMDQNYEDMLEKLDSFSTKAKDKKDFDEFMVKVNEIESIVKGFSSNDDTTVEQSFKRADNFLANHEKSKKKLTDDGDDVSSKSSKKCYNKTVINDKAFKDDVKKEMNPDEFMKTMEEDAKKRNEDRQKRRGEAEELKKKAEARFNAGDYKGALETYDLAINTLRDWASLYTGRAQTHLQLGNIKEAMSDCDWAFKADSKSLNAHITQGKLFMATKEYSKAVDMFQKAIDLKPNKKSLIQGYLDEAMEKERKK